MTTPTKSKLEIHHGEVLHRIASTYPTIPAVIMEQVQNALDVAATDIQIVIDFKSRFIATRDNGNGVSRTEFEEALVSIGHTTKKDTKLGRYGIGMISPLDKCERFLFTSCPRGKRGGFREWQFVSAEIKKQKDNIDIPCRQRLDLSFDPAGARKRSKAKSVRPVDWRTEVKMIKLSKKVMSKIRVDRLRAGILNRFGAVMRESGAIVLIKIRDNKKNENVTKVKASLFRGQKLDEVTIGSTTFKFFKAPKTTKGQNGKIVIGEAANSFRIPIETFVKYTGDWLDQEVGEALQCGVLEGEITDSAVTLHPSRKHFENNEDLLDLCRALTQWYEQVGFFLMEEIQDSATDERYQRLGRESLAVIEDLIRACPEFQAVIQSFRMGNMGEGHAERPGRKKNGEQRVLGTGGQKTGTDGGRKPTGKPKKHKPNHRPGTVEGPKGKRRTYIHGESQGLNFSHRAMEGSDSLWELDMADGCLHFNIRHPLWAKCEGNDRHLLRLQEMVAIQALTIAAEPEEWQEQHRLLCDEQLKYQVELFTTSSSFNLGGKRKHQVK